MTQDCSRCEQQTKVGLPSLPALHSADGRGEVPILLLFKVLGQTRSSAAPRVPSQRQELAHMITESGTVEQLRVRMCSDAHLHSLLRELEPHLAALLEQDDQRKPDNLSQFDYLKVSIQHSMRSRGAAGAVSMA